MPRHLYPTPSQFKSSRLVQLVAANGSPIKTYGSTNVRFKILGRFYDFRATCADVVSPILGMDFFQSVGRDLLIDPNQSQTLTAFIDSNDCISQVWK